MPTTQQREIRKEIIDNDKISVEFGTFIRETRERKGFYLADVAEIVGVSRSYYAFIESGKREIYFTLALNLCRAPDLDIKEFMKNLKRQINHGKTQAMQPSIGCTASFVFHFPWKDHIKHHHYWALLQQPTVNHCGHNTISSAQ